MRVLILATVLLGTTAAVADCWMPICEPIMRAPAGSPPRYNPNWIRDRRIGCPCLRRPTKDEIAAGNAEIERVKSLEGSAPIRVPSRP